MYHAFSCITIFINRVILLFTKPNIKKIKSNVEQDLNAGVSYINIKKKYRLKDDQWYRLSSIIYKENYDLFYKQNRTTIDKINIINNKLLVHCMTVPRLINGQEINILDNLLNAPQINIKSLYSEVIKIVMHPNMRAMYLIDIYSQKKVAHVINPVYHFRNYIDAATLAFYRGNYTCAMMTIIPVVEGILLRWQGFPNDLVEKPSFGESIRFLKNIKIRQPIPSSIGYFDSWFNVTIKIIEDHLFKSTEKVKPLYNFNRHLVAHLLNNDNFCSVENIARAFMLIDIMLDLYLCENRIPNYYFTMEHGWFGTQKTEVYKIYMNTFKQYFLPTNYEHYLRKNDRIVDLRHFV